MSLPIVRAGNAVAQASPQPIEQRRNPSIQAVNLTKVYGDRTCVDRLNLTVYEGELYALLGDNGAGKTTTISMLTTLLKPTSGEFFICGHNGLKESEKTKGAFGIVSQDVAIYSELTAYENLKFVADLYGLSKKEALSRIESLLTQAGLADRANDRAADLSGGMQRKLSIANALLHKPSVLFMDEPTVGLDPASRRQIWASLKDLRKQGVTILLTTHYLEEAELLADRIGIIRRGRLVAEGTIEELRNKIKAARHVQFRLAENMPSEELEPKLKRLRMQLSTDVTFDQVSKTISLRQPQGAELVTVLEEALEWLEREKIPFIKFSTSEPTLEEVFLAVAQEPAPAKDTSEAEEEVVAEMEL